MLPVAAALGYATSVIHIYGLGPFIEPIAAEFGWSRTQTTAGLTVATLIQAALGIPIGIMVDRFGPRVLGLAGVLLASGAFALLGTATGGAANWYLLWAFMAIGALPVQATIWTSAVATRFEASRGLAFAVTLCGASVAAALFPWLGTRLIADHGWRTAFMAQGALWAVAAFPLVFLFFRGARDIRRGTEAQPAPVLEGVSLFEGVRSTVFARLLVASLLYTFTILALVVHFIPILRADGVEAGTAASIAALIGLFSLIGRLGTGYLLDRYRGSVVGAVVFLLPIGSCLLLMASGSSHAGAMVAAALIGLTLGAEVDVIVYLVTRHFGLKNFGALYGGMLVALSVGTAAGPLGASFVYDRSGGYDAFLGLAIGTLVLSSLCLLTLPRPAFGRAPGNKAGALEPPGKAVPTMR